MHTKQSKVTITRKILHNSEKGMAFYSALGITHNQFKDSIEAIHSGLEVKVSPPNGSENIEVIFEIKNNSVSSRRLVQLQQNYSDAINKNYNSLLKGY